MAVDGEEDKSKVAELESFAIAQFKWVHKVPTVSYG